jgi:hypothetical protein
MTNKGYYPRRIVSSPSYEYLRIPTMECTVCGWKRRLFSCHELLEQLERALKEKSGTLSLRVILLNGMWQQAK